MFIPGRKVSEFSERSKLLKLELDVPPSIRVSAAPPLLATELDGKNEPGGIPYWSLVLPLTLLSARLNFAKPRKAKAATGSMP